MPFRRSVTFANAAVVDLENVRRWYVERGAPEVGERLLREIIHPPFRIVYRIDAGRMRSVRVWRGERVLRLP